jgi:hypothetical protein
MADPEELLGALPDESPPAEIVLAAVRVFRYRALAVIAVVVALLVGGVYVVQRLEDDSRFMVQVARAGYEGGVYVDAPGVGDIQTVDGMHVVVWEVVGGELGPDPRTFYVHLLGWSEGDPEGSLELADVRFGGVPARVTGEESSGTGERGGPTRVDLWFAVETSGLGPLTFDAEIVRYRNGGSREVVASVPFEIGL